MSSGKSEIGSLSDLSHNTTKAIRFGVMCPSTGLCAWQKKCLEDLLSLDFVRFELLIEDEQEPQSRSFFQKLTRVKPSRFLWQIFKNFYFDKFNRSLKRSDFSSCTENVPRIKCQTAKKGKHSEYFNAGDINTIRSYNLDFILRFGFGIVRGEILKAAKFGIWSFHHGDIKKYRGGVPGFWEIFNNDPLSGAVLQRLTEKLDGGIVLKSGAWRTITTSYVLNHDNLLFESVLWPRQVCVDIANDVSDYLNGDPVATKAKIFSVPTNIQMVIFVWKIFRNRIKKFWRLLFVEQWNIGIIPSRIEPFFENLGSCSRLTTQWFEPLPAHRFCADPFIVSDGKETSILFEDFDYRNFKGCIRAKQGNEDRRVLGGRTNHFSYPYAFKVKEEIFCIPETGDAREIALYRAVKFPYHWEKAKVLISDFPGIDATVFEYQGRWWLWATSLDAGPLSHLYLWSAPDVYGPWSPHPGNPVKIDASSARPAGMPFVFHNVLYRPAQDCSRRYGEKIVFNRIDKISKTEFSEHVEKILNPLPGMYSQGLHTISFSEEKIAVDGLRYRFIFSSWPLILFRIHDLKRKVLKVLNNGVGRKEIVGKNL